LENFGIPRTKWQDNAKIGLRKMEYEDMDWIHLVQDGVPPADSCEHGVVPLVSRKAGEFLDYLSG
jgi:hypothetical protein